MIKSQGNTLVMIPPEGDIHPIVIPQNPKCQHHVSATGKVSDTASVMLVPSSKKFDLNPVTQVKFY